VCAFGVSATDAAIAQDPLKIGFILPMTRANKNSAAIKLYMAQHGDMVAGKKVELIIRDDGAVADNTRRIAHQLGLFPRGRTGEFFFLNGS
jgi:branched-chain amino acid transport system substrate-binding protein